MFTLFLVQIAVSNLVRSTISLTRCIRRGGAVNNHAGNKRFRGFINKYKHEYLKESKQRKPFVAMRVLDAVRDSNPPGRYEDSLDVMIYWSLARFIWLTHSFSPSYLLCV